MEYLYRHFDGAGRLLYVGISLAPIQRTKNHAVRSKWFNEVRNITIQTYETRQLALDAETLAIANEKPVYNVKKSTAYLKNATSTYAPIKKGDRLSQYERDILRLIVYGMDDREIGASVGISPATVQSRRRDLMRKTGVHSSPKLIAFGRQLFGLSEPEIQPGNFGSKPPPAIDKEPENLHLELG